MALNIKNPEVDKLLDDVVALTGETKTEAVRKALEERQRRLALAFGSRQAKDHLLGFLQDEVWPRIPADQRGRTLTRDEEEALLGYGEHGV